MAYSEPNSTLRREINAPNITGAASASMAKFHMLQKTKLKSVSALVVTAGTHASAGIDIYNGTTSVGAITLGTSTAGSVAVSGAINATVADSSFIELKGKANSATLVASFAIEHEVFHDATKTA